MLEELDILKDDKCEVAWYEYSLVFNENTNNGVGRR